jgi:phosphoglucomutase
VSGPIYSAADVERIVADINAQLARTPKGWAWFWLGIYALAWLVLGLAVGWHLWLRP